MVATTTVVIKMPLPVEEGMCDACQNNIPVIVPKRLAKTKWGFDCEIPLKEAKMSFAPLPKANNVTP